MTKCIIAGCARNIESTWGSVSRSLEHIFDALEDYRCVLVESHSTDQTLSCLQEWASVDSRRHVISLGSSNEPVRTKRIATARNVYLTICEQEGWYSEFPYLLVVDLDDVLSLNSSFAEDLSTCFIRNDWDAIGSNRRNRYYDIWALRCKTLGCDYDCWDMMNKPFLSFGRRLVLTYGQRWQMCVGRHMRKISRSTPWIPCTSAFGGMALYKTDKLQGRRYNGDKTCEHVSFHSGLRMFINPAFMSGT